MNVPGTIIPAGVGGTSSGGCGSKGGGTCSNGSCGGKCGGGCGSEHDSVSPGSGASHLTMTKKVRPALSSVSLLAERGAALGDPSGDPPVQEHWWGPGRPECTYLIADIGCDAKYHMGPFQIERPSDLKQTFSCSAARCANGCEKYVLPVPGGGLACGCTCRGFRLPWDYPVFPPPPPPPPPIVVPKCPASAPEQGNIGDGWCRDCLFSGNPIIHCGLSCYRNVVDGPTSFGGSDGDIGTPGQQCCYDENGELVDENYTGELPGGKSPEDCMGNLDQSPIAKGENDGLLYGIPGTSRLAPGRGCCVFGPMRVGKHIWHDVIPGIRPDGDGDKAYHRCMRAAGIPSGNRSGSGGGATFDKYRRAHKKCR